MVMEEVREKVRRLGKNVLKRLFQSENLNTNLLTDTNP